MKDLKLILGVVGGSLLLLVLIVFVFSKMDGVESDVQNVETSQLMEGARWVKDDESVKVTVVEFSDLQCPACRSAERIVGQIDDREGVRFVYRHFPLISIHEHAFDAGVAAEAAGEQGKFWEYKSLLFARQSEWSESGDVGEKFVEYAIGLDLDEEQFMQDLKSSELKERVRSDYQLGSRLGVSATPTFFVNRKKVMANELLSEVESKLRE